MFTRKWTKRVAAIAMAVSLLSPATLFAQGSGPHDLNQQNAPERGSSQIYIKNVVPFNGTSIYHWTAAFETTTHYQIPNDIDIPKDSHRKNILVYLTTEKNTGNNTEFDVELERYYPWSGWIREDTKTGYVGWTADEVAFKGIKDGERYRIRIRGNVKGTADVFSQW